MTGLAVAHLRHAAQLRLSPRYAVGGQRDSHLIGLSSLSHTGHNRTDRGDKAVRISEEGARNRRHREHKVSGCQTSSVQKNRTIQTIDFEMDVKMNLKQQNLNEKLTEGMYTESIEKGVVRSGFHAWAKNLSVETGGIQRVIDEERRTNTTKVWNACTFW